MWQDIREVYSRSWRFMLAFPLLFLIPAIPEFVQHVVEFDLGMYSSLAAFRGASQSELRLGFGLVKALALGLPGYWFVRYLAWPDAPWRSWRAERPAIWLWLVIFALQAATTAYSLFGPSLTSLVPGDARTARLVSIALQTGGAIFGVYLTAWGIGWVLGNVDCGPIRSVRIMLGSFWRTIGYIVASALPLMIVHYALGIGAIGRPVWLIWPMLAVDAVVVGFLGLALAGSSFVAARQAARRTSYPLAPARTEVALR